MMFGLALRVKTQMGEGVKTEESKGFRLRLEIMRQTQ